MRKIAILLMLMASLVSCRRVSQWLHEDEVVAQVGKTKLYLSQVREYIPDYVSPEDSVNLAMQYINSWATDLLYLEVASAQLSKQDQDVSRELEDYRQSLLRYRYEQQYINDRLDTTITDDQIRAYYESNQEKFTLERPILKVRFLHILQSSLNRARIQTLMRSSRPDDLAAADSLAAASAIRYYDNSDVWMDAAVLAKDFGVDYNTMLAALKDKTITIERENGELLYAYVYDIMRSGTAPVDFCSAQVRALILSNRKHRLVETLEQDLLQDALGKKKFVIY